MSKARREKRNEELEMRKLKNRTYTYADVLAANRKYDIVYTTAAICAVRETFKAGKVRIGTFAKLMFDQIEGLSSKTIDATDMLKACQDVGVHITQDEEKFSIYIEKGR
jgi:hypothetical protein